MTAGLPVIADLFARLPLQRPGFFGEARQVTVGRVVHRLLQHLDGADAAGAVRASVPGITHPEVCNSLPIAAKSMSSIRRASTWRWRRVSLIF